MRNSIWFAMIVFLGIGGSLGSSWGDARTQEKTTPLSERVKRVRQMYEKIPSLIFEVLEPVQVVKATMYEDGGTIVVELKDAKGKEFVMILDRRIGSPTRESMFVSYTPYSKTLVLLRGPEEAALYGILLRWKAAKNTVEWTRVSAQAMIEHLDARFAVVAPAKKKEPEAK